MLFQGFKFGILFQFAIGPVCMYIFSLGTRKDILSAQSGVIGTILAEGLYMYLAALGMTSFIKNRKIQKKFNYLGSLIVFLFGLELFLGYFKIPSLSITHIFNTNKETSPFVYSFLLTISNPMNILFWIGIFSTKIDKSDFNKKNTLLFGLGSLLASLIFLMLIAYLGTLTNNFLPNSLTNILNAVVGLALIYLGIKKTLYL